MSKKEILQRLNSQQLLFMFGTQNINKICIEHSKNKILDVLYDISKRKLYLS